MKYKKEYEDLLKVIIEDLRVFISYTKSRDNDLLCLMEQYLKAEKETRPALLVEIRNCMDEKEYKNPFLAYQHYEETDIQNLEEILKSYISDMKSPKQRELVLENTIVSINELHVKSYGQLVDRWRSERLIDFLVKVAKEVSFSSALAVINEKKLW